MLDTEARNGWLVTLAQTAAWLFTTLVAIVDALFIRETILSILKTLQVINNDVLHKQGFVGINYQFGFAITAVDMTSMLLLGIAVVVFTIWVEYYMRKGRPKGLLWKRLGKVIGIQFAVIAVMVLIITILYF